MVGTNRNETVPHDTEDRDWWYIHGEKLALQLHFVLSSESMGNHDSGYDEWRYVC